MTTKQKMVKINRDVSNGVFLIRCWTIVLINRGVVKR